MILSGDWSDRRGTTRHYSTLAHSRPGPIERNRQALRHFQKHRPTLPALETIEPAYAEQRFARAIDKYAFQLSALLKTEAAKSRKQRRTLKQIHEDLKELGFEGSYDRVAAFARVWREGQTERVNPASKRTENPQ